MERVCTRPALLSMSSAGAARGVDAASGAWDSNMTVLCQSVAVWQVSRYRTCGGDSNESADAQEENHGRRFYHHRRAYSSLDVETRAGLTTGTTSVGV